MWTPVTCARMRNPQGLSVALSIVVLLLCGDFARVSCPLRDGVVERGDFKIRLTQRLPPHELLHLIASRHFRLDDLREVHRA